MCITTEATGFLSRLVQLGFCSRKLFNFKLPACQRRADPKTILATGIEKADTVPRSFGFQNHPRLDHRVGGVDRVVDGFEDPTTRPPRVCGGHRILATRGDVQGDATAVHRAVETDHRRIERRFGSRQTVQPPVKSTYRCRAIQDRCRPPPAIRTDAGAVHARALPERMPQVIK